MAIYLIKMAPTCLLCFCCFFVCFQLVKTSKIWSLLSNLLLQFKLQTRFLERKLQFWVVITSWKRRFGSENEVSFLNWYNWYNLEMKLLFQNISFDSPTEASILETKHLLKQETNSSNELSQVWHLLISSSFIYWLVFENELFDHGKYLQWQKVASIEKVKLEHFSFKVNKFYFCLLPGSH